MTSFFIGDLSGERTPLACKAQEGLKSFFFVVFLFSLGFGIRPVSLFLFFF